MRSPFLMSALLSALSSATLASSACHDGPAYGTAHGDAGDTAAHESPTAHYVCDVTFGAVLRSFESCCSAAERKTPLYRTETSGGPRARGLGACEQDLGASAASSRVRIDGNEVAACARDVAASVAAEPQCWHIRNRPERDVPVLATASCKAAVVGLQREGQACRRDYECADGLTCVGWELDADGACRLPPAIGESCGAAKSDAGVEALVDGGARAAFVNVYPFGDHPACVDGASCDGECEPPAPAPTPAPSEGVEGDRCGADADCADGLFCATQIGSDLRYCMPRGAAGAACDLRDQGCDGYCEVIAGHGTTCKPFCGAT